MGIVDSRPVGLLGSEPKGIVGRLAPSPTGALHLGHARTFLLAYWYTRSRGGSLVLRLEDVDVARSTAEYLDAACRDLEWLGLDWDGPPRIQSERLEVLREQVDGLVRRGLAYPCVCTRGELREVAARQARAEETRGAPQGQPELRYPGTCFGRFASREEAERRTGRQAGIRLSVTPGPVSFHDEVHGPQAFDVEAEVGDFLVERRDKTPAYQLAVVVDDALDGVTEVVRGDDLLPSAARQLLVGDALGARRPTYAHVPLVTDASGRRLAKREADLGLTDLRARGVDPRSIVAWAATSARQLDARVSHVTAAEVLEVFELGRVPKEPVRLEPQLSFAPGRVSTK